jgi:hypothetical protein
MLQIGKIETVAQAKKFAERIAEEPRTYFLQGSWGSGKTDYVVEVKNHLQNFRFIELKLWKPKDKSSLGKYLFSTIYPKIAAIITVFGCIFVILSIIGSIVLAIKGILPSVNMQKNIPLLITTIAVILTTLYGFLQSKWLDIDRFLMNWFLSSLRSKQNPKILIIDDFDRLDAKLQDELYIIFNAVHETTRVLFIGDLNKINNVEDNYLGKIIDQKVALPFSLHSRNVAQKIQEVVSSVVDMPFDFSFISSLFVTEMRTARDANQFLTYVENEFINQSKKDKVQIDQQLFVIYLYLFHPHEYQALLDGWLPDDKQELNNNNLILKSTANEEYNFEDESNLSEVQKYMRAIFQPRKNNPADFRKNTSVYFVNEFANNHSIIELKEIISTDGKKLKEFFLTLDSSKLTDYEEFLDFVRGMGKTEYTESQSILEKAVLSAMKSEVRHEPNQLIKFVFEKRNAMAWERQRNIMRQRNSEKENVFVEFEKMFNESENELHIQITNTEKRYYFRSCLNLYGEISYNNGTMNRSIPLINEQNIAEYYIQVAQEIELESDFGNKIYDAEALIVQLGYHYWLDGPINPTKNPDFKSKIESIEKLSSGEYCAFWNFYGVKPYKEQNDTIILQGGAIFKFEYNGQTYEKRILHRLINQ